MFRVKPRANLGLIFFTVLIQKSGKTVESTQWLSEEFALGNSLGHIFPDNHCGLSTVYTTSQVVIIVEKCQDPLPSGLRDGVLEIWRKNISE